MTPSGLARGIARAAGRVAEEMVAAGFAASRPLLPRVPAASAGAGRVLVVAPHPDDEAAGCAGVLLAHRAAGGETRVLVATDGRRSRAGGLGEREMASRRRREAEAAAAALGAGLAWIGLPEGAWPEEELSRAFEEELDRFDPALVYAPSGVDFHPDHVRVARVMAGVLAGGGPLVRSYQVQVPLGRPLVNRVADVSGHADALASVLRLYETQWGSLERTLRLRRYAAARHGVRGLAEEFWELEAERWSTLHAGPLPDPARFRGLRCRPFTDPLPYLAGGRARRALLGNGA